ncbi:nucleoside triphosphate pyrophosphohydrolase [Nitratireductor sp. ZSWI3]|uniref:nucleoside triphosphate pyrophosphohydrolase n=1 Tax=Nitratireductor sp. ZSWI3 TaxID=2966359 RepID=UPI0021506AF0|nr:nucleoside triphosphate pyrophosphohydrolase [Nitratireductor sp. ZSWI3]MCR4266300.1 nucleoside triphosphate pyrophosphohydrolase [Nitratireductor sp. ZSWI3]
MQPSTDIARLLEIMAALRTPGTGCPWDVEQDFASIAPYTIEEAYEVADAIERGDMDDLREELGDLLLQVVFHARMAEEKQHFAFGDVVQAITAKMIRRHPHVFGDAAARGKGMAKGMWDKIKADEKAERQARRAAHQPTAEKPAHLDEVPRALPALMRALKLQQRAARVGFDWGEAGPVLDKIEEEIGELRQAITSGDDAHVAEEYGDLLFALANLGRHLGHDPEASLAAANDKFRKRFGHVERALNAAGRSLEEASLADMEALWQQAKSLK